MQNKKKDEMIDLRGVALRYLREWKWFVFSVFCCLGLAFFYLKITSPVYQINANVLVKEQENSSSKSLSALKNFNFAMGGAVEVEDELQIISSFSIMRKAVAELGTYVDYTEKKYWIKKYSRYKKNVIELKVSEHIVDTLSKTLLIDASVNKNGSVDIRLKEYNKMKPLLKVKNISLPYSLETEYGTFQLDFTSLYKAGTTYDYRIILYGLDVAAEIVSKRTSIGLVSKKSNTIHLYQEGSDVTKSKDILNKLIELYNEDALIEKNQVATNTSIFLNNRLGLITAELSEIDGQVERYKKDQSFVDLELEAKVLLDQNREIQTRLVEVSAQLSFIEDIQMYLLNEDKQYELLPLTLGIQEETALNAIQEYNKALLERIKLQQTTTSTNPALINLNGQIEALRKSVFLSIQNVKGGLSIKQKDLSSQLSLFNARFQVAPTIEKEFLNIKRNQLIKEELALFLMQKKEENSLTLAASAPKAKVIDYAFKQMEPITPNKQLILMLAMSLGILIPVLCIYFIDLFKITFDSKLELESVTHLPIIGEVCENDTKDDIVVKKNTSSSIVELFRLIRTNIQFVLNKKEDKVLLVTSTQSGEGKSFFSLNIALSLALMNKKVVLVGLDLRRPTLDKYSNLLVKNGVTNFLIEENMNPEDITVNRTPESNLDIIFSGPIPPNPGELIVDKRLDELFTYLRTKYDYVIVDSAPVGLVSDSFMLDRLSDMTIYVTRANYSPVSNIKFAEKIVSEERLKKLYLVVNGTNINKKSSGYTYGYGYNTGSVKK